MFSIWVINCLVKGIWLTQNVWLTNYQFLLPVINDLVFPDTFPWTLSNLSSCLCSKKLKVFGLVSLLSSLLSSSNLFRPWWVKFILGGRGIYLLFGELYLQGGGGVLNFLLDAGGDFGFFWIWILTGDLGFGWTVALSDSLARLSFALKTRIFGLLTFDDLVELLSFDV